MTDIKKTKWLITGGCGFIGLSILKNLLEEGNHFIRIIDNLKVGSKEDLSLICSFREVNPIDLDQSRVSNLEQELNQVEFIEGDVLDANLAIKAAFDIDIIVHLAANTGVAPSVENPKTDLETNVMGTFNYLEAARSAGVKRFILASSGAPAGEVEPPIHEEIAPHPVSPYGASKLACEGYCSAYFRTYGVDTVCLRFGNVYGPLAGKKNSIVAKFIKRAIAGYTLEIYGDGSQTRDFIYIDDLVNALKLSSFANSVGGEIFQIATNKETTVQEIVDYLLPLLEEKGIKNTKVLNRKKRQGDVLRNFSDTSKARRMLEWNCKIDLPEGLDRTVQWFVDR